MRLPTRLDRYPAKMVGHLADRLIVRFASDATRILDPFCGSGAILAAAARHGIACTGLDINPMATVLTKVKLHGFDPVVAADLAREWISAARSERQPLRVDWAGRFFWFTPATLSKYENLRGAAGSLQLTRTREGLAVLLAYLLSVRLCSRADQRSPKPFISRIAIKARAGLHFDPYSTLLSLLDDLAKLYPIPRQAEARVIRCDLTDRLGSVTNIGKHSHSITSPPYINAQDYFRNFKLELYMLDGITRVGVESIRERFIGTDRGDLLAGISRNGLRNNRAIVRGLKTIEARHPRLGAVVHRYCHDMGIALGSIQKHLQKDGTLIIVCGDNLVGGVRIATWRVIQELAEERGFKLFDRFSDEIADRLLAPMRSGHRGLIKQEVVSGYRI